MKTSPLLSRLALLVACASFVALEPRARADEIPITPEARIHFIAGVRLLQDPAGARYEEAYQEFKVAYASSPSPRILDNVGLCAMKLERDEEAIQAYEKYLGSDAKIDPGERAQIESDLGTLKASVVYLTLTLDVPVTMGETPKPQALSEARVVDVRTPVQAAAVTNVYGPFATGSIRLGIHPGHHIFTVKRDGYTPASWELDALPGSSPTHVVALQKVVVAPPPLAPVPLAPTPAPPPPIVPEVITRPTPTSVIALGALTVAAASAGALTGVIALAKRNEFNQINDGAPAHFQDASSLHDTGQKLNVATDVLLGAAVVGAAITIGLYAARPTVKTQGAAVVGGFGGGSAPPSFRLRLGVNGFSVPGLRPWDLIAF